MPQRRRGLTVIELVIILIVIVVAVVLLLRLRNREPAVVAPPPADTTVLATPAAGAGNALASRLVFLVPRDSTVATGDTILVRLRATSDAGTAVNAATVTLQVTAGDGSVIPASGVTDDRGEVEARWVVGPAAGTQTLRAAVQGAPTAVAEVSVQAAPATGAR